MNDTSDWGCGVCRLAKGQQLPDAQLYALYALAVMGGTMLASLFLLTDSYGPYKVRGETVHVHVHAFV